MYYLQKYHDFACYNKLINHMTLKFIFKITTNNVKKSNWGSKSSSNGLVLYHSEEAISPSQRLCYFYYFRHSLKTWEEKEISEETKWKLINIIL